ncbi:tRNA (N6-isopentenyl adenosine(37)-C2)-methylthiotransferase MiaB [Alloscardovia omnicolens]|uniref:tRNA (N6-isopentenyl adenosine(37)-C2)-methylthiotransferase MiaB n=1 Tax=Alloscardovia omnicolens TaxID=419015 RepID=UPI003A6F5027
MNEDMMTRTERLGTANDSVDDLNTTLRVPSDGRSQPVYYVHTLGCQMNAHDSERIAGVLEADGYTKASQAQIESSDVDLIVLNTCAVRENATSRMYGTLGQYAELKRANPQLQIAVGGCMAQKDRQRITQLAPWVDAVFGTKNIGSLTTLLHEARRTQKPQVEVVSELNQFPSELPTVRASKASAWVSISVGCNNTCTFCIVPAVRGKERDRRPGEILAEIENCVERGIKEVTLLGQNVNSYGYATGDRFAFSKLLRACGEIEGLERVRFTSPHPAAFTPDVIDAMAHTPNVMPQLHMPLQSGSDKVLRAMRRSYRIEKFMTILDNVRAAISEAEITTDIIVGFPGETEEDFQATMDALKRARFTSAYIFEYSPRPGTPAATMEQVPAEVSHDRFKRLHALQEEISAQIMSKHVGKTVEIMITELRGAKDAKTHRVSGRDRGGNLVHLRVPEGYEQPQVGDFVTCTVTESASHYLIADPNPQRGDIYELRH